MTSRTSRTLSAVAGYLFLSLLAWKWGIMSDPRRMPTDMTNLGLMGYVIGYFVLVLFDAVMLWFPHSKETRLEAPPDLAPSLILTGTIVAALARFFFWYAYWQDPVWPGTAPIIAVIAVIGLAALGIAIVKIRRLRRGSNAKIAIQ